MSPAVRHAFTKISAQIQELLLCLTIFLLPINLFAKYEYAGAFVNGILVDYLLPKFYLSDIPILILLALWLPHLQRSVKKIMGAFALFATAHLLAHLQDPNALSTLWFLAKMMEMLFFALWLIEHKALLQKKSVGIAIIAMMSFQFLVAGYQYVEQKPLFDYHILGEPQLNEVFMLAKRDTPGAIRILPYGTTPHPNILAAIFVAGTGMLIFLKKKSWMQSIALVMTGVVIALTQSTTAFLALIFGVISVLAARHRFFGKETKIIDYARLGAGVFLTITVVIFTSSAFTTLTSPSIVRRAALEHIAVAMTRAHIIAGVGLNRFTTELERFGMVPSTVRFLQPVHNIPLLYLAETGLIGIIFLVLFYRIVQQYYSPYFRGIVFFFVPLCLIFSLDHFIFTLQQGQLLFIFLIALMMEKRSQTT